MDLVPFLWVSRYTLKWNGRKLSGTSLSEVKGRNRYGLFSRLGLSVKSGLKGRFESAAVEPSLPPSIPEPVAGVWNAIETKDNSFKVSVLAVNKSYGPVPVFLV